MRNENDLEMLCLPWNFASQDLDNLPKSAQYEYLDPDKFLSQEYIDSYWSKSEILLSFSSILNATADHEHGDHPSRSTKILETEYCLYGISCTLGQLAALYHYYKDILQQIKSQKIVLIDFFEEHEELLTSKNLHSNDLEELHRKLIRFYEDNRSNNIFFSDFYYFLEKPWLFFHRMLHEPTEMEALRKLEQLGSCIQRIKNPTTTSTRFQISRWWNMDEIGSIWESLKEISNTICHNISMHSNNLHALCLMTTKDITDIKGIFSQLLDSTSVLSLSSSSFNNYKKDILSGRKCIARGVFNKHTYVSFSGYADSTDPLVMHIWRVDDRKSLFRFFEELCRAANVKLANLSPQVVRQIMWYECGIAHGPMKKDIQTEQHVLSFTTPPTPKKLIPEIIQKKIETKYSCCERKILTQIMLDYPEDIICEHDGVLYVKFSPCTRCEGALLDWESKFCRTWDVHYLYEYTKK